jgi:hypothetical protein
MIGFSAAVARLLVGFLLVGVMRTAVFLRLGQKREEKQAEYAE